MLDDDERLDAATFSRWCNKRLETLRAGVVSEYKLAAMAVPIRGDGSVTRLAGQLGVDPTALRRILKQQDTVGDHADTYPRWRVEKMLQTAGVELWEVYDGINDGIPRDSRGRSLITPRGVPSLIPEEQVRAAWILHQQAGLSLREIGRRKWQAWGYKNAHTAANALSSQLQRLGFTAKPNTHTVVAMSTTHGKAPRYLRPGDEGYEAWREHVKQQRRDRGDVRGVRCAGIRLGYPRKGQPCQLFARAGSDFCRHHDPDLREEIVAMAAAARAHLNQEAA